MSFYDALISKLPGVSEPKVHLNFKSRLKWTGIILLLYLLLGQVTIYGLASAAREQFAFLEMILGASFGSIITLGIGPIVTASIILQLLVGSKVIPWNLKTPEGRSRFQGTQKLLAIAFCVFEAIAFATMGAITPVDTTAFTLGLIILQLAFGGFLLLLMDEVVSKWGIGSGISLFIAAGVTKGIFVRAFNPLTIEGSTVPAGLVPQFASYLGMGEIFSAIGTMLPILATILVFLIVVYVQGMKVEIPLAFGSIRGFSRRWPLKLIYTSNIPVILTAALLANLQLMATITAQPVDEVTRCGLLGCMDDQGNPTSGLIYFLNYPRPSPPGILPTQIFFLTFLGILFGSAFLAFYFRYGQGMRVILLASVFGFIAALFVTGMFVGLPSLMDAFRSIVYLTFMVVGATVFSIFWVSTSGMDARSVAEQIEGMGMQIPGFRRDPRIVEQVLNRYIPMLAIISGAFVGVLASLADFTAALGTGTGILLTVMIIHNFYEQISMRYVEDMHPAVRRFFE